MQQHDPSTVARLVGLALSLLVAECARPALLLAAEHSGVVVEKVEPNSEAANAGLQAGDQVLGWVRAVSPPANLGEARGLLTSPFDLAAAEIEEGLRGPVTLTILRDGRRLETTVRPGRWGVSVRPHLPTVLSEAHAECRRLVEAKEVSKGLEVLREAVARADPQPAEVVSWLSLSIGVTLTDAGRFEEAHAAYQDAAAAVDETRSPLIAAAVKEAQARAFQRQNKIDEGQTAFRAALVLRERVGAESLSIVADLHALGALAERKGDLAGAEELQRRALAMSEKLAPDSLSVATSLLNLGRVIGNSGNLVSEEEHLRRALAIAESLAPESLRLSDVVNNLAVNFARRGDLASAEPYFRQVLAIQERLATNSATHARTLMNLGGVANSLGDLPVAEEYYRRALAVGARLPPGAFDPTPVLQNLGTVAAARGDFAGAEGYFRRALEIWEKRAPESDVAATLLHNIGTAALDRGDFETAELFLRRALSLTERLAPGSLDLAHAQANLGNLLRDSGALDRAEQRQRLALAIREEKAPGSLDVAISLDNLGDIARRRGDFGVAEVHFRRAVEMARVTAPGGRYLAAFLQNLATAVARRGAAGDAEKLHREAVEIRGRLAPGSAWEAESLHALGLIARDSGDKRDALDYLSRAVAALEAQQGKLGGAEETRSAFNAKYLGYYGAYLRLLLELGRPEEAFHVLERSRARSLLAMLAERDLLFSDIPPALEKDRRQAEVAFDRLVKEASGLSPVKDKDKLQAVEARFRELRDKRDQIALRIREASPRLASLRYPEPMDSARVQAALDPGTVLLAYHVGEERSVLFVITAQGQKSLSVHDVAIGERPLRERVTAFRGLIQRRGTASAALDAAAAELYALLVKPAEAEVAAGGRVLISPDGPLHSLPFGALMRSASGQQRYLAEWKPLHFAVSATVYAEMRKAREGDAGRSHATTLVAFGDPRYPTSDQPSSLARVRSAFGRTRGLDFEPLPSTREEIQRIAALYPASTRTYLGEEATEENAKAIGRSAKYVHFACHGILDERTPLNSALALSIPENPQEGADNGLLQAWEIIERFRTDADLVTLSACETGLGKEMGGEGLVGLTRAFQYAGARSVLASLWSVSDESTATLMTGFYKYLKAGLPKDAALQRTQVDMARSGGPRAHPFHWAAFHLNGDYR